METVINYFSNMPSLHRSLILATGIAFFWIVESAKPLFTLNYKKWNHAKINFFFTATTIIINFSLAFLLLKTSQWVVLNNFGLLQFLPKMNFWIFTTIGLLFMDLISAYLPHFLGHKLKFLWRFHLIHHTDAFVDTTTANRHHPGESVVRFILTTAAVFVLGTPMWMIFLYQTLSVIATQFNHANIVLPKKLDQFLSFFIVSPDMHKVHHHFVLPYTDSNYGNIFSVWDRIFGTFKTLDRTKIIYGVDTHMKPEVHSVLENLVKIPFQKQH